MNIEQLLTPFWEGETVYDETIMLVSENGRQARAKLFYTPKKILSVKSTDLKTEYKEGRDWKYCNGEIIMSEKSKMPFMKAEELHFYEKNNDDCFGAKDGGYILYKTEGYFHKRQLAVTYTHNDTIDFGIRKLNGERLFGTKELLKKSKNVKICFYGDSITAGCDGSKKTGIEPFMPGWPELFASALEKKFNSKIEILNTAVPGENSDWGARCAEERLALHKPDLAVVAFGMNDGTQKIPACEFGNNIKRIKEKALEQNENTEFIFISTTLPNPESVFDGYQRDYYDELIGCTGDNDTVLDMTSIHSALLERKAFADMTGNNINHPNDFLIRIYAQALIDLFR